MKKFSDTGPKGLGYRCTGRQSRGQTRARVDESWRELRLSLSFGQELSSTFGYSYRLSRALIKFEPAKVYMRVEECFVSFGLAREFEREFCGQQFLFFSRGLR